MLEVKNRTPFAAGLFPGLDRNGTEHAVVVVKTTFAIAAGKAPRIADEQAAIEAADVPNGIPGRSSVRYASDVSLRKPATDVYVVGTAYPPKGVATYVDVGIFVGTAVRKTFRVVGDRRWERHAGLWSASPPAPFEAMPLLWERAYGGRDPGAEDPERAPVEPRNPVGTGYARRASSALEGAKLPNLEDLTAPIRAPSDHPAPVGVGAIAANWEPRTRYAGTMDEAWQRERFPLLPLDFDDRFLQVAPPDQIVAGGLRGGERIGLVGLSRTGPVQLDLPAPRMRVHALVRGGDETHGVLLDTVLLEPDKERLVMTWRADIPCGRNFLRVERVKVEEA